MENGLLLRADLHTLFDMSLLTVASSNWSVLLSPSLRKGSYRELHGSELRFRVRSRLRVSEPGIPGGVPASSACLLDSTIGTDLMILKSLRRVRRNGPCCRLRNYFAVSVANKFP